MKEVKSNLDFICIGGIKGNFNIPSYQRGYKWTSRQVTDLLNDVWEFYEEHKEKNDSRPIYCLQPLVISGDNIVDGQQRLTTIYIILKYLETFPPYALFYVTRQDSTVFLENICTITKKNEDNPDYYHMSNAIIEIKNWFADKSDFDKEQFKNVLLNDVKVILYTIKSEEQDARDVFTKINNGKISLTNSELVKALFLRESNRLDPADKISIAREWEEIEYKLQDDQFWYFLCKDIKESEHYETRIEFILDIIANKTDYTENNEFFTYDYFDKKMKEKSSQEIWGNIEEVFNTLIEWYDDREYCHYIGFLILIGESTIREIKNIHDSTPEKIDFLQKIRDLIKKNLGVASIENLGFNNKAKTKSALLLFNIETIIRSEEEQLFNFKRYKEKKWSLEHIHAQQSEDMSVVEMRKWIEWHWDCIDKDTKEKELNYEKVKDSEVRDIFKKYYESVYKLKLYNSELDDIDSIGNMALLDIGVNSALSNSIFPIKRKKILKKIEDKNYVLTCTKKVFNKEYDTTTGDQKWTSADATKYEDTIRNTIEYFFIAEGD